MKIRTEPIKAGILRHLLIRRTERLLIGEVELNSHMGLLLLAAPGLPKVSFTRDKYDYLQDKEKLTIFEIDKGGSLCRLYHAFEEVAACPKEQRAHLITYEFALFEDAVKQGVMGRTFRRQLCKPNSPLGHIAAKYTPPSQQMPPAG